MILILVECSNPLAIDNQALEWFANTILKVNWFAPYPEPLGARVYSRTNAKTIVVLLFKKNPIKQKRLSCAIFASNCDHSDSLVSQAMKEVFCLLTNIKA